MKEGDKNRSVWPP